MGFLFKRIDLVGGSENFPSGDSDELRLFRSKTIVKSIADTLISMGIGWQLDQRHSSTSDFFMVPARSGDLLYPSLILYNTSSHCKLFIAYFPSARSRYSCKPPKGPIDDESVTLFGYTYNVYIAGVVVSMLPSGSLSDFGNTYDEYFLPDDATRLIGSMYSNGTSTNADRLRCYAFSPEVSTVYSWGIWATPYCFMVSNYSDTGAPHYMDTPAYAVGKIFGTLVNQADGNTVNSYYGVIAFRGSYTTNTSSYSEGRGSLLKTTYSYSFGLNKEISLPGCAASSSSSPTGSYISFARADGTWFNAHYADDKYADYYVADWPQLSSKVYNSVNNGKSRWLPIEVVALPVDIAFDGVTPGDGFKGYLDTDLFRCAIAVWGQEFDNHHFICTNDSYNMLFGWDASNDPIV